MSQASFPETLESLDPPFPNLGQLLAAQAERQPDKTAIIDGEASLSYGDVDRRGRALARRLRSLPPCFRDEEPVAILARRGIDFVLAQVAVVYAGGTCIMLDAAAGDGDVAARVRAAGASILMVSPCYADGTAPASFRLVVGRDEQKEIDALDELEQHVHLPLRVAPDYRSHIVFTSGTTGPPKGIEILGRGVVRLSAAGLLYTEEDRVGQASGAGFDVAVSDVWTTLTVGATAVVVRRRATLLSPERLDEQVARDGISALFLTASVFSLLAAERPTVFGRCRCVFVTGEAPSITAVRRVLGSGAPPRRLINAYGPAECGIVATLHDITTRDADREEIPLGTPIDGTRLLLADPQTLQPICGEGTGELLIGGDGLARGYLGDEARTKAAFPELRCAAEGEDSRCFYRTSDMVRRDGQGRHFWCGRMGNEVKHHGYRVSLDAVEAALASSGLVRSAAALTLQDPGGSGASWLVACVVPQEGATRDHCQHEATSRLPSHAVPRVVCVDEMPLTRNAKTDRAALRIELLFRRAEQQNKLQKKGSTEDRVRSIWQNVLGVIGADEMGPDADFLLLGTSSLDVSAATLAIRREFGVTFPVQKLYGNPVLRAVVAEIDRESRGSADREAGQVPWVADAENLGCRLSLPPGQPVDWTADGEGRVLLTGATGFIGAFLLRALVALPCVRSVRCLVRARTLDGGRARLLDNLARYGLVKYLPEGERAKISPVLGDLECPALGLDPTAHTELATWANIIFHLGARVDYNRPYSDHRDANVLGTLRILELAAAGPRLIPVHHASSISVFGPSGVKPGEGAAVYREDESLDCFADAVRYESGYGQSKWAAERLVTATSDAGLPAAVYRLGFVLCHAASGAGNSDDYVGRLISDAVALGVYPRPPSEVDTTANMALLPVDFAVSAILAIAAGGPANFGRVYHITPDPKAVPTPLDAFLAGLDALTGCPATVSLPRSQWVARLQEADCAGRETRLKPLLPVLAEPVLDGKTRWEWHDERPAVLFNENTRAALTDADQQGLLVSSSVTGEDLVRYLGWLGVVKRGRETSEKKAGRLEAKRPQG